MKPKSRGNGQGSAYKRGNKWEACVTIRMVPPSDPSKKPYPLKRRKGGFATKKEALEYCPILLAGGVLPRTAAPRLSEYWETYKSGEYKNLSSSKQTAYTIAWNRLRSLQDARVDTITVDVLRSVVSSACSSYYTARDCRSLLSNLFKLAAADGYASKDLPSFIVLPQLEESYAQAYMEVYNALLEEAGADEDPGQARAPDRNKEPVNVSFYVINTNTDKFHYESCRSVKDIKPAHRTDLTISRDLLLQLGFSPCKICKP